MINPTKKVVNVSSKLAPLGQPILMVRAALSRYLGNHQCDQILEFKVTQMVQQLPKKKSKRSFLKN